DVLKRVYDRTKGKQANADEQPLLDVLTNKDSPAFFPRRHTWHNMSRGEKDAYGGMKTQFDKIALKMANAPPRAMVLNDAADIVEPKIFVRGNPAVPGAPAPRQFLRILCGAKRPPF